MAQDNLVVCYEGIQRIYRNAIVRFLRTKMHEAFPEAFEDKLRAPFQKEWDGVKQNALISRNTGELTASVSDDFDLLSVNHFFNLFDAYYDALLGASSGNAEEKKRQKQTFLNWIKTIKNLRDPLSHPVEEDFSREDAFQILDCARRVLIRLNLVGDANQIKNLMDRLFITLMDIDAQTIPLEDRLPPRESIVVGFVGRDKELNELREWFFDPVSRRWALAGEGGKGKSALAYGFAVEVKLKAPKPFQAVLWLSAKKRRFLEGTTITIEDPDFSDLDSALSGLLTHYGWIEETDNPTESKRKRVLELLSEFPAFLVVDDIDSLETENENVIEFFSLHVPQTRSKVLFTSRRTIFGMGGTTTHVSGFTEDDTQKFILSRCQIMELDPAIFNKAVIQRIIKATEGSPLYIEDLLRLTAVVQSASEAIKLWEERGGNNARRYALGRECEKLTSPARKVLLAACIWPGPVSFAEIETVTGASRESITAAIQELQRLFLAPKPRLIEGEHRFEVNFNTRVLVREEFGSSEEYRRIQQAYRVISEGLQKIGRGDVGALIRQAVLLIRDYRHLEAEELLLKALQKYPSDPDLIGILGLVYKTWQPPRITDARERFNRSWQLKCLKQEMYEHWCRMEIKEYEWTRAAEAAEKGLKVLPDNRMLLYLAGYSHSRLAKELQGGLHHSKAQKEMSEARKLLEAALKAPNELEVRERSLNADIYRALVLACEMAADTKGMQHYFRLWRSEHPDDPHAASEWERVSKRYALQA